MSYYIVDPADRFATLVMILDFITRYVQTKRLRGRGQARIGRVIDYSRKQDPKLAAATG